MIIYYSPKFEKEYRRLPVALKKLGEKKERIFRNNPLNPALKTHRLAGKLNQYWSFSINFQYRIIFEFASRTEIWFHSIGTHAIYK